MPNITKKMTTTTPIGRVKVAIKQAIVAGTNNNPYTKRINITTNSHRATIICRRICISQAQRQVLLQELITN